MVSYSNKIYLCSPFSHKGGQGRCLPDNNPVNDSGCRCGNADLLFIMKIELRSKRADYIGITGSVLCMIHCLITPVLLMTSALLADDALRIGYLSLDYVFIGVNMVAVYFATRHNISPAIKLSLWSFLGLFTIAILLEDVSEVFEYVGYAASMGLVITHFFNIRSCRASHTHSHSHSVSSAS